MKPCLLAMYLNWLLTPTATQAYTPTMALTIREQLHAPISHLGGVYFVLIAASILSMGEPRHARACEPPCVGRSPRPPAQAR